jgi:hypothetical protein
MTRHAGSTALTYWDGWGAACQEGMICFHSYQKQIVDIMREGGFLPIRPQVGRFVIYMSQIIIMLGRLPKEKNFDPPLPLGVLSMLRSLAAPSRKAQQK